MPTTQASSEANQQEGAADRQGYSLLRELAIYDTSTGCHTCVASFSAQFAQESGGSRESAAVITGEDQLRQLCDQHAARPPVEPDLYACSVQQGVDPTAPQATQPVTRPRPVFTHTGPEREQPPPPPKAHWMTGLWRGLLSAQVAHFKRQHWRPTQTDRRRRRIAQPRHTACCRIRD